MLHGVPIVKHIDLYPRGGLVDPPAPPAGLPQCEQLIAGVIKDQRGKSVQVKARLHKGRICNQDLEPGAEPVRYPLLPLCRFDLGRHNDGVPPTGG